ncbi:MAG: DUF5309 domain-containing protein [Bacteroides sp.]|nr:DUF5309 domain-containing protein [Bacteroides sp.]MCM1379061.1 DUF5309 domain-containing protein [Bacteroides sp.]MCM1445759.1 DUF5309 domain-containing protein [Prevotella sp.]
MSKQITGEPLTTTLANQQTPELLRNDVDRKITKLRPMATPIDQLSRYAASRPCKSMTVDYYAVATRPQSATLKAQAMIAGDSVVSLTLNEDKAFDQSETIMLPDVKTSASEALIAYVMEVNGQSVRVKPVNVTADDLFDIPAGAKVVRMGRAAGELDVQTAQYEALPEKMQNYCQIFKTQIEQSTLMRAANKEVGWTFSDQEEVALYDMRLAMERTFLFGTKARFTDTEKKCEVFLTGGIWNQAGKDATYPAGALKSADWLKVMSTAFTGHAGSARKILVAGTELIEQLSLLDGNQRVMLPGDVVSRWGLDFTEMHSKFGTLYVIHSEVLDSCGHSADGLIIDPEFLTKYVHVPFSATTLDLRTSGQRNTEAVVMTEVSCLVLRYPEAHVRVTATKA